MSGFFRGSNIRGQGRKENFAELRRKENFAELRRKENDLFYEKCKKEEETRINLGPSVSIPPSMLERVEEYLQKFDKKTKDEEKEVCNEFERRFHDLLSVNFEEFIEQSKEANITEPHNSAQLSTDLKSKLNQQTSTALFQQRYEDRLKLPAMIQRESLLEGIMGNQVTLIVGSTGCGKTTQVPQILLDHYIEKDHGALCRIVCTQPRRISAVTVAERVASERCERLGSSVGYQIRLESTMPREHGSILYCTTGILLQKMQTDPLMNRLTFIILDEIHERSVETDLLMALLKQILPHRPELKVILMSATVSEEDFCKYFDNCCTLRIEGTLFPVKVEYLEDILQETGFQDIDSKSFQDRFQNRHRFQNSQAEKNLAYQALIEPYLLQIGDRYDSDVQQALRCADYEGCEDIQFLEYLVFYICENKPAGAILVFLPGFDKIAKLNQALVSPTTSIGIRNRNKLRVYPLHSMMPTQHQQSVFRPPPAGLRKVILSTILAETSVTIDDVVYVINTGRTKITNYNAEANIESLDETWVTKANSMQRKGRAGRVQPGICYNLFTRARESTMDDVPTPEILRSKLEGIILNLKLLHISDESSFLQTLLDCPNPIAVQNGINILKRINALDARGLLTPLGWHLTRLPIDPQMGKMILMAALFRCLDPITSVAAGMSYKSPFYLPLGKEKLVQIVKQRMAENTFSDHLLLDNVIQKYRALMSDSARRDFCYKNFLSFSILQQLENMKQQFSSILHAASFAESSDCKDQQSNVNSKNVSLLRAIIAAGLYPNMAHLKQGHIGNRVIYFMSTPEKQHVSFHPSSINNGFSHFNSKYFVYFHKQKSRALYIMDSSMVFPMALLIFGDNVEAGITPEHEHYISVGKCFFFKCDEETANIIIGLRNRLQWLLQKMALYPSTIAPDSSEEYLIKSIQILLSLDGDVRPKSSPYYLYPFHIH